MHMLNPSRLEIHTVVFKLVLVSESCYTSFLLLGAGEEVELNHKKCSPGPG